MRDFIRRPLMSVCCSCSQFAPEREKGSKADPFRAASRATEADVKRSKLLLSPFLFLTSAALLIAAAAIVIKPASQPLRSGLDFPDRIMQVIAAVPSGRSSDHPVCPSVDGVGAAGRTEGSCSHVVCNPCRPMHASTHGRYCSVLLCLCSSVSPGGQSTGSSPANPSPIMPVLTVSVLQGPIIERHR